MQKLFVCSRPLLGKDGLRQHLIGILEKLDNGEYQFQYRLDNSIESNLLMLPIFPDRHKIYNDTETRVLLEDYLPSENDTAFIAEILRKTGLDHYDEWTWLLTFDSDDVNAETFLYETLPDDIVRHDYNIEEIDNDDNMLSALDDDILSQLNENDFDDDLFSDEDPDADNNENNFNDFNELADIALFDDLFSKDTTDELTETEIPEDNFDEFADIELPEDDFSDVLNDFEEPSNDNIPIINDTHVIAAAGLIEKLDPKPVNTIKTITVQTTYKREKRHNIDDFIEPPPESPMEKIQQRLIENQKLRKEQLAERLKHNPYTN